jgi:hypothetical protein
MVLIVAALTHAGNETLPDTRLSPGLERVADIVPVVEVTHDRHFFRIRSPNCKQGSFDTFSGQYMGSQLLMETEVAPLIKQVGVILGQNAHIVSYWIFQGTILTVCIDRTHEYRERIFSPDIS